jgi:cation-transporting P-type ATPase 13A2
MYYDYQYYATCILVLSICTVISQLVETRTNMMNLRQLAYYDCKVKVKRSGKWIEVSSDDLVPGDVIEVP